MVVRSNYATVLISLHAEDKVMMTNERIMVVIMMMIMMMMMMMRL